jgi:predicted nucleic acid-binding protein
MNNIIVPDANVFLEMVYGRSLQSIAMQLITDAIVSKIQLVAPSLFLDEITEVLCGNLDDLQEVQQHLFYLEQLVGKKVLLIVVPSVAIRMKAIEIARTGNPKSGYPELSDALYHALAIISDGIFVTNDSKYIAKVKRFGRVAKLGDYQKVFERTENGPDR